MAAPSSDSDRLTSPARSRSLSRSRSGAGGIEATPVADAAPGARRSPAHKRAAVSVGATKPQRIRDSFAPEAEGSTTAGRRRGGGVDAGTVSTRGRKPNRVSLVADEPSGPVEAFRGGAPSLSEVAGQTKDRPGPPGPSTAAVRLVPRLSTLHNALNASLMVSVALPALLYGWAIATGRGAPWEAQALAEGAFRPLSVAWWLAIGYHRWGEGIHVSLAIIHMNSATLPVIPFPSLQRFRPLLAANLIFFANVDVLFWVLSLIQNTTWVSETCQLIDNPSRGAFRVFLPMMQIDVVLPSAC